jgi:hypothetical protein
VVRRQEYGTGRLIMPGDPPVITHVAHLTSIIRKLLDPAPVIEDSAAGLDHSPASTTQEG